MEGAACRIASSSRESGATPLFAVSPPTLISIKTANFLESFCADAFNFSASCKESTESIAENSSAALATLLDCRWPIMCHSAASRSRNLSALLANSCTRFSPKRRNPAAYASRMRSGGCVLVTAMSAISSGLRPARLAAATRSRTRATFSAIDIDSLNHRGHGVTQRCQVFFFYWESTRARRPRHTFRAGHFMSHDGCGWCWFAGVACSCEGQSDHQDCQEEHHDHSAEKIR